MTVGKTRNHVKQALNGIYRALIELHDATREVPDKTLDEAFKHVAESLYTRFLCCAITRKEQGA